MNWDALGAVAELVGAVAVVITLAYLAIETRRNTIATRSASTNQTRAALTDVMSLIAGDDETASIYHAGLRDPDELAGHQRVRFDTLLALQVRATEVMFTEYRAGLITEDLWGGHWRGQRMILSARGGRAWWLRHSHIVSEEFRDWLNAELGITGVEQAVGGDAA